MFPRRRLLWIAPHLTGEALVALNQHEVRGVAPRDIELHRVGVYAAVLNLGLVGFIRPRRPRDRGSVLFEVEN